MDAACDAGRAVRAYRVHVMHVRCGYLVGSSSIRVKVGVGMWEDFGIGAYRPEMRYRYFDYRYAARFRAEWRHSELKDECCATRLTAKYSRSIEAK